MKIWNKIPIKDNGDKLIDIPSYLKFFEPHPYYHLGAPYKDKNSIWKLRREVVNRLVKVNDYLISNNNLQLLIYDSWRPLEVQEFMFKRAFLIECKKLDIDASIKNMNSYPSILKKVEKFWAYPSFDSKCPPPHSTGGALDVSLSDKHGNFLEMGSKVDQMDETSYPDFYSNKNNNESILWNSRRNLLRQIMTRFGFVQHPNEWWHYSYGDQLWAWKNKKANALYGKI
ncbi:D-Ala-D-Ala dipeptidase [Prochlorococcus marinus str. MU1404]|uniref:M15 family metallopeptidase n=1 Tax=Prochlorococcus marinus TaxID=1219 RepID=UPI001ADC7AA7|nr:M15 family metallopeptidase [Prochlorococcus marinus]MBO8229985.1 M15 family metallopeptidase [Prochlorococcus marinus XMU1404]MBW3073240.1 D-Ala-D-Ala dipeptidase [Prochlorococcus marinus str. MU1404]MCR8545678.1 D-Ala-D-Ala dipeptidase [Prochlorococcus marinus CUG1432]